MDDTIFFFFYNLTHWSVLFDKTVVFLAVYFPFVVIITAFLFLLYRNKIFLKNFLSKEFVIKHKEYFLVFFSGAFAWCVSSILKMYFHTPRPFAMFDSVASLFSASGYAFPSGHATAFMALAVAIYFCNKKVGYFFIGFAVLIGLARIVSGVHFPVDILGGLVLGTLIAYAVKVLYEKFFEENKFISPQS